VGVFVNEEVDKILSTAKKYQLDAIQLHGKESIETCQKIKDSGLICIKAFSIEKEIDFEATKAYESYVDYFLFDTKTSAHGGSGQKFDWTMLDKYVGETPFFLSGGISYEDVLKIKHLTHPKLYSLDINSRFEIEPGLKDIQVVKHFFDQMKK
jgi:phosphoribosylanthranilate isomerase